MEDIVRTDSRGKDQKGAITRHEMPESMSLDEHTEIIPYHIPYRFELITEYIIDVPDCESTGESEYPTEHRLDDFTSRGVIGR